MKEDKKVLLVYDEADNEPIEGLQQGWVSNFHRFLQSLLSQLQKEEPEVLLKSSAELKPTDLKEAFVVMTLVSQNLVDQGKVLNAIKKWANDLSSENELMKNGLSRLLKIRKSNFDLDTVLPEFASIASYDLFYFEGFSGKTVEYTRFFGSETERGFWMKLIDIAYDLMHILEDGQAKAVKKKKTPRDKTIYLASTGLDMLVQRDIIKRELKHHGYEVLPSNALPKTKAELEQMVREDLTKCRLSIHLIGEDYGYQCLDSEMSVVEIQNNLADEYTAEMSEYNQKNDNKMPFSRLVWLSPDLRNMTERQRIFVEDIKSKAALLDEAEVLQIQLQELKSIIKEELVTGGRISFKRYTEQSDADANNGDSQVYLIADKSDLKASEKLQKYLEKKGFRVLKSAYEGTVADIRVVHQDNLRRCDGSIIYYGNANHEWIKTKLSDLLKAPGLGRNKPTLVKAVYVPDDKEFDKTHFEKNKTMVLNDDGDLKTESLEPFISQLKS